MNKKVKYIIFIISVLIFILGCNNNATNPSTFEELGKYRGTWVADNVQVLNLQAHSPAEQWKIGPGITIKINSDTDIVIDDIVPISINHLPDTVDTYYVYISTTDLPPEYSSNPNLKIDLAYYKLEFTSHNSVKANLVIQATLEAPVNMAIEKADLIRK
uniref:hypothetical protein n=1 Tax=Brachyspira catarrhinii TaxID=2528966 RepID=UPI003F4BB36B